MHASTLSSQTGITVIIIIIRLGVQTHTQTTNTLYTITNINANPVTHRTYLNNIVSSPYHLPLFTILLYVFMYDIADVYFISHIYSNSTAVGTLVLNILIFCSYRSFEPLARIRRTVFIGICSTKRVPRGQNISLCL